MLRLVFGSAGLLLCLMASAQATTPVTMTLPADAAIVVRGQQGLFFSTALTLFVVPVLYRFFMSRRPSSRAHP